MSNVLIGIIGVILFIGLALAGALFLGPKFQQATMDSKASAAISAVDQIDKAITQLQIDDNATYDSAQSLLPTSNPVNSPVSRGYLKALPKNGVNSAYDAFVTSAASTTSGPTGFIGMTLDQVSSATATAVCLDIVKRTGQNPTATSIPTGTAFPNVGAGCIQVVPGGAGNSSLNSGYYYIFSKV